MKTDWKSLKGKVVLVRFKDNKYYVFRYFGGIRERKIYNVSPSGKLISLGVNRDADYGFGEWYSSNDVKLLDVL